MADQVLSPLSALEQQMGIARGGRDSMDVDGGAIPDTDDDTTPPGRAAVSYATAGDGLFSPPAPPPPLNAGCEGTPTGDPMADGLMSLLGDPSGALGADSGALIAQLEAMAEEFERQSGEPETEIRGKIALLRSVLASRPGVVAQSRARMDAAVAALDAEPSNQGAAASDAALHSVCAATVDSIEGSLGRVEATLQTDPAAAALVSSMLAGQK